MREIWDALLPSAVLKGFYTEEQLEMMTMHYHAESQPPTFLWLEDFMYIYSSA